MYKMKLSGKIGKCDATVKKDGNVPIRRDVLEINFEFTEAFAAGLGEQAERLQGGLGNGDLHAVTLNIDPKTRLVIKCQDGDKSKMKVWGETSKLKLKSPNKEDACPQATLISKIATTDEAHLWFLHHLEETVSVKIDSEQVELGEDTGSEGEGE
jgi:hypothetical protein